MTTCTKRDIKAADMLKMIRFGFGLVLVFSALLKTIGKTGKDRGSRWRVDIAGVFLALGAALNLKVRQLVRTRVLSQLTTMAFPIRVSS